MKIRMWVSVCLVSHAILAMERSRLLPEKTPHYYHQERTKNKKNMSINNEMGCQHGNDSEMQPDVACVDKECCHAGTSVVCGWVGSVGLPCVIATPLAVVFVLFFKGILY